MQNQLAIVVCSHILPEVQYILDKERFPDIKLIGYPAHCLNNTNDLNQIIDKVLRKKNDFSKLILITSSCFSKASLHVETTIKVEIIQLDQCFEIVLNKETLHYFIMAGYYIVTNGWLRNYKKHIQEWGFDKVSAKMFFNESMKKILLLNTGLPGDYLPDLVTLADYMGLPFEVLPIGSSHLEKYFSAIVSEWRADIAHNTLSDKISTLAMESADYLVIFNQLNVLVDLKQEIQIVQEVFALLMILFAPAEICYRQFNNGIESQRIYNNNKSPGETEKSNSFSLDIDYQGEKLGVFEISCVKFPQYLDKYKKFGKIISHICSLSIANARKYEIMEEQKEQLTRSNQSKDKFFSILAHDLRSPFNALLGLTDILSENLHSFPPEELQLYVQGLSKSAINLNRLLENLLEWSRVNQGLKERKPEKMQLLKIVNQAVSLFRESATRKSITIQDHIPEKITVMADFHMIDSIIRNLISNAVKFTPRQGSVMISAKKIPDKKVLISISDSGIGMNKEIQDNLFKLDAKISRPGTDDEASTGLGLLLCKEFVEMHGGKIWAESKEGEGSTFYFTVPS